MTKLSTIIISLFLTLGCKESKTTNTAMQNLSSNSTINQTKEKSGYFLQINNQNCHYEIRVNDLLVTKYIDSYPAYSVRHMLNGWILKRGKQKLSIRVTPLQGDILSKNADITIRLLRYPDMLDKENDFGGSTMIMEWEMPQIEEDLPYFQLDTIFNAEVPYEINDLDNAVDLSKIDIETLTEEVVKEFKRMLDLMMDDYDQFNILHSQIFNKLIVSRYHTIDWINDILADNKQAINEEKTNIQPIENYTLQLYGNGRIATLERIHDGGNIIWAKDPETGNESLSLPLFIYKDKRDNKWYLW
ncbi:hypothetical protein [Aquimarina muelleri]|uniref:Uncharacterized protein n=1 Tax=Aquimarina muelleri TaxID=279356 RepID=A0A918N2K1_9FLAO|nr:hypothetical protein [Aquimarina muelleri]MCX2764616.1 hypothetical protein [Aquimarina muelleri]GGX19219.1 hypothetical protein GCM10007384_20700 [Aquimarina muelleri]